MTSHFPHGEDSKVSVGVFVRRYASIAGLNVGAEWSKHTRVPWLGDAYIGFRSRPFPQYK